MKVTENRFWCLEEYEGETSPIVDSKYAITNGWLCSRLNELYTKNKQLKDENKELRENVSKLINEAIVEILLDNRYEGGQILEKALRLLK